MNYLKQIAIALDQLINTIFGGFADETLSSRAYRYSMMIGASFWHKIPCKAIDTIFFWDKKYCSYEKDYLGFEDRQAHYKYHCQLSYESEKQRLQLPPEFRK